MRTDGRVVRGVLVAVDRLEVGAAPDRERAKRYAKLPAEAFPPIYVLGRKVLERFHRVTAARLCGETVIDAEGPPNYDAPHFRDGTAEASDDQFNQDAKLMREIEAMPADEWKKRMMRDKGFAARIESAYTRKWLESRRGRARR